MHSKAIDFLLSQGHSKEAIAEAVKPGNVLNIKQNQIYVQYKDFIN